MSYTTMILIAAKKVGVSGALLLAICTHETNLRNVLIPADGQSATYGVCQVKFETAEMLGYSGKPKGLMDPATNAYWAAQYLKYQENRYNDGCKAVAAYNAGRFNESSKLPGKPRNLKYVLEVQKLTDESTQMSISCDPAVADTDLMGYVR